MSEMKEIRRMNLKNIIFTAGGYDKLMMEFGGLGFEGVFEGQHKVSGMVNLLMKKITYTPLPPLLVTIAYFQDGE